MNANYSVGDKFRLSPDALENYQDALKRLNIPDGPYTVRAIYTHYVSSKDMQNDPTGHPGFDPNGGSPLYGSEELPFDLYEWEMTGE